MRKRYDPADCLRGGQGEKEGKGGGGGGGEGRREEREGRFGAWSAGHVISHGYPC